MTTEGNKYEAPREVLLNKALGYVMHDRNSTYDEPEDNFRRIADLQNAYLASIDRDELWPHDIAILNILQKVARLAYSPDHADSWVDIAGYAACGWDCIVRESLEPEPTESVLQLAPEPEQDEDIIPIRDRVTGDMGEAIYYSEVSSNLNRVMEFLRGWEDQIGVEYRDHVFSPGEWVVVMDEADFVIVSKPEAFGRHYEVAA